MNRPILPALLLVLLLAAAQWIKPEQAEISSFVRDADKFYSESMAQLESVPGAAVVVVKDGKIIYQKGFGYADLEKDLPFTHNTAFYIASCTKAYTGLMAAQLDAEGIIPLDSKLIDYFPDAPFHQDLKISQITLKDLLTHSSGLENDPIGFRVAYSGEHNLSKLIDLLKASEPNRAGYGKFQYSNIGYNIYAMVVEKVTGRSWKDVLADKVFQPLGMQHTTAYISDADRFHWPLAAPYYGLGKDDISSVYLQKRDNTMQSAGGLITTCSDLGKWLLLQLSQGKAGDRQIFPAQLLQYSQSTLVPNDEKRDPFPSQGYGLGWHNGTYESQRVIWHYGGFPGAMTHISFIPDANMGVGVFVNDGVSGYALMNLFATFAYDYFQKEEDIIPAYQTKMQEALKALAERQARIKADMDKRQSRRWQLSQEFPAYSGTFTNELYGDLQITGSKDGLWFELGNMHCQATPFTEAETARIEMVPFQGEVVEFVLESGKVSGLKYSDLLFEKQE